MRVWGDFAPIIISQDFSRALRKKGMPAPTHAFSGHATTKRQPVRGDVRNFARYCPPPSS